MKCKCGEDLFLDETWHLNDCITLVMYYSPEGHNHDDNCITRLYKCKNEHYIKLGIIRRCHACDWKGSDKCFCCTKVEKWPEPPK